MDGLTRFLPLSLFAFRAWEGARRFPTAPGPFTPQMNYRRENAWGDLASLGNYPKDRFFRQEIFTTDAFGFRNPSHASEVPPDVLVCGDSFAAGNSVSDAETLAAQVERITHLHVYNVSSMKVNLMNILAQADRLKMQSGTVIMEYLERNPLLYLGDAQYKLRSTRPENPQVSKVSILLRGFSEISPLQILSRHLYQRLLDDRIFPNSQASEVIREKLRTGQTMLFLPEDVDDFAGVMDPINLKGILKLQKELEHRHLRLVLLLTPDKYSVYAGLLMRPPPVPAVSYLDRVAKALHEAHVPAVNLLPVFQAHAAADLPQNLYLYWPDDTHWNARGIQLAAEEVSRSL
jgi:hypothetical protein